jgi:hypothetical protein
VGSHGHLRIHHGDLVFVAMENVVRGTVERSRSGCWMLTSPHSRHRPGSPSSSISFGGVRPRRRLRPPVSVRAETAGECLVLSLEAFEQLIPLDSLDFFGPHPGV